MANVICIIKLNASIRCRWLQSGALGTLMPAITTYTAPIILALWLVKDGGEAEGKGHNSTNRCLHLALNGTFSLKAEDAQRAVEQASKAFRYASHTCDVDRQPCFIVPDFSGRQHKFVTLPLKRGRGEITTSASV